MIFFMANWFLLLIKYRAGILNIFCLAPDLTQVQAKLIYHLNIRTHPHYQEK
jgi:hypothetical protein